jgi:hypothetical protein
MQTADALIVGGGGREMDARLPCVLWLECGAGAAQRIVSVSFLEEFDVALSCPPLAQKASARGKNSRNVASLFIVTHVTFASLHS